MESKVRLNRDKWRQPEAFRRPGGARSSLNCFDRISALKLRRLPGRFAGRSLRYTRQPARSKPASTKAVSYACGLIPVRHSSAKREVQTLITEKRETYPADDQYRANDRRH
jgi:hypothetical protein